MTDLTRTLRSALPLLLCLAACASQAQGARSPRGGGDHIVAVVNSELVTSFELTQRVARVLDEARRSGQRAPAEAALRQQALEDLIDERVLLTYARDSGMKVEETEIDRAVAGVAAQNQLTLPQLRQRLASDGLDYTRFRNNLRDQILLDRLREREVAGRIRITDADIERFMAERQGSMSAEVELNIAQILVQVPEGADEALVAQRRARAEQALARVRGGEDFAKVAAEVSQDANRERGGELGARPASRLPDLFVDAVRDLPVGGVSAAPVRSGAGFHVLKLLSRGDGTALRATQTRARHILLRTSAQTSAEAAARRLEGFKKQVEAGQRRFEDLARDNSEDGSAAAGGDLGWVSPGAFVPEFEEAMNKLPPGGISAPVVSRFGVHLIQVQERREVALDAKEVREQARNALREQKFEQAFAEWTRELRARAYVEMREPPQ
jgi:peptidyl-prolyl cis-trans isomerase SurA